jgi:hypothetical protein
MKGASCSAIITLDIGEAWKTQVGIDQYSGVVVRVQGLQTASMGGICWVGCSRCIPGKPLASQVVSSWSSSESSRCVSTLPDVSCGGIVDGYEIPEADSATVRERGPVNLYPARLRVHDPLNRTHQQQGVMYEFQRRDPVPVSGRPQTARQPPRILHACSKGEQASVDNSPCGSVG